MAELTRVIALDCEMVEVAQIWWSQHYEHDPLDVLKEMVGRVSLVNEHLECIMDAFIKPTKKVSDYRTRVSGIRKEDLENGEDFKEIQSKVKEILKGRILVGHAVSHDLDTLGLAHPKCDIRDTSQYKPFIRMYKNRTPGLRWLAKQLLGITIQVGEHSSVEDARAVMRVYQKVASKWEESLHRKN